MYNITVTTHKHSREYCELNNLIAIGTKTTEDVGTGTGKRRQYRHIVTVTFRGETWRTIYINKTHIEPYCPQCAIPCSELGCEMIDYVIF